jgi:phospholipase/carboxylesterase
MSLQTIELHPDGQAVATIIVLHGLGADGTDFQPLADELDLSAIGPIRWLLPRAPVRPVTLNNGYRMRAWYDILGTELERAQGTPREDTAGLRDAFAQTHALLDREVARGVPAERIVLAGFSQGCAVALGAGLRYGHRLAGLAGLSGYLPLAASTAAERHAANAGVPIFLGHGTRDAVVPHARGAGSRDALAALGYRPEWHEYPMEHSVSREEIADLERWLLTVLPSPA